MAAGVLATLATGNLALGGGLIGFGAGFIYGGSTGKGAFDWNRAAGFGLSGAMVGAW